MKTTMKTTSLHLYQVSNRLSYVYPIQTRLPKEAVHRLTHEVNEGRTYETWLCGTEALSGQAKKAVEAHMELVKEFLSFYCDEPISARTQESSTGSGSITFYIEPRQSAALKIAF